MNHDQIKLQKTIDEFCTVFGIDSYEQCRNPEHFKYYSKNVIYKFNQMGYRDAEWPQEIQNNIWCVGDSFTVGLGQPFEETWPQLVQQRVQTRVINVSMNGASNNWIGRRIQYILDHCEPAAILVQWSYLHRREHPNTALLDEDRALHFDKKLIKQKSDIAVLNQIDVTNLLTVIRGIENKRNVRIIHSFIPNFYNLDANLAAPIYQTLADNDIVYFPELQQLDFARDGFHYDIQTATQYADKYIERLQT
jgi:hypothetical protein